MTEACTHTLQPCMCALVCDHVCGVGTVGVFFYAVSTVAINSTSTDRCSTCVVAVYSSMGSDHTCADVSQWISGRPGHPFNHP